MIKILTIYFRSRFVVNVVDFLANRLLYTVK